MTALISYVTLVYCHVHLLSEASETGEVTAEEAALLENSMMEMHGVRDGDT